MPESDFESQVDEILDKNFPQNYPDEITGEIVEAHKASLASEREKIREWVQNANWEQTQELAGADDLQDLLHFLDPLSSLDKGE